MPKVGAHISAAGSLDLAFDRAQELGAACTQIFITPPQQWVQAHPSEKIIRDYRQKAQEMGIIPNFIHAVYLVSLATPEVAHLEKSIKWLISAQQIAEKLGMEGTILHIGSYKNQSREEAIVQVAKAVQTILDQTGPVKLILENSAGAGNLIGDQLGEMGDIVRRIQDQRLKVCLDTQHAFASGYDLRTQEGVGNWVKELETEIGLDRLIAIHANDSKVEFNSRRDRHENIGKGFIGLEGFKILINHPDLQNVPFILEVPGQAGSGPDKNNIELLKHLIVN